MDDGGYHSTLAFRAHDTHLALLLRVRKMTDGIPLVEYMETLTAPKEVHVDHWRYYMEPT